MWQKRRIKAFTLMELVVTLIVSSILFGACYFLLQMVQRSYAGFSNEAGEVQEVNNMQGALSGDFHKSKYIVLQQDGLTCYNDSVAVSYQFGEVITRQANLSERVDTFYVAVSDFVSRMGRQMVVQPGQPIESLFIEIHIRQDTYFLHFFHPYSAEEKMLLGQEW